MASYTPQSGINGRVIWASNSYTYDMPVDTYVWSANNNIQEAPSFTGAPFVEHCNGMKRANMTVTGTWNADKNPFNTAPLMQIGDEGELTLKMNADDKATAPTARIASWDITDFVDGKAEYVITFIADWKFDDFGDDEA